MFTETVHITVSLKNGKAVRKTFQVKSDGCWHSVQSECAKIVDREIGEKNVEKFWWSY